MTNLDKMIEKLEIEQTEEVRDYNFRKVNKKKEQLRRKEIYEHAFFPTMPRRRYGENGEEYYTEGSQDELKNHLKRIASKKTRQTNEEIKGGNYYRRLYPLSHIWY